MGKSNSKLKPEVVEELTRKTYCECIAGPDRGVKGKGGRQRGSGCGVGGVDGGGGGSAGCAPRMLAGLRVPRRGRPLPQRAGSAPALLREFLAEPGRRREKTWRGTGGQAGQRGALP